MSSPQLAPDVPATVPVYPSDQISNKRLRAIELLLVLSIAFAEPVFLSLIVVSGTRKYSLDGDGSRIAMTILNEALALSVLAYVLYRQGRSIQDLLKRFRWQDITWSIPLAFLAYAAYALTFYGIYIVYLSLGKTMAVPAVSMRLGISALSVLFIAMNPFFEELIVRGHLISEVEALTNSGGLAVLLSVVVQCTYHLYQGVVPAIAYGGTFAVLSIYYLKTKRIWPVILAHLYMDAVALAYYR